MQGAHFCAPLSYIPMMRYSDLFGKTRRDAPADITQSARRLAFRAGLIRVPEKDRVVWLPLATRIFNKMQTALQSGLDRLGAQELRGMPGVNLDLLAAQEIQSYKQLPSINYWHSGGLTRVHLAYLASSEEQANDVASKFDELVSRLFHSIEVNGARANGVANAKIYYAESEGGDLEILRCSKGNYAATRGAARPGIAKTVEEPLQPMQEIPTPHSDTIESLANFLNVPTSRTAKAVFYSADNRVIFAVIRGDLQIDEDKLKRALGISRMRFASDDEIQSVGASPGYASPVGVRGATIVIDHSIAESPNLVAGANREGFHLLNTNVPRDYQPDFTTDLVQARVGDACPNGDGQLELHRALELAQLTAPRQLEATYLDANGRAQNAYAGELEIDLGNALLAYLDSHHDEKGIVWSRALAPFDAHIVVLNTDKPDVANALQIVIASLAEIRLDYLLDDRPESAGVKFNDADLIGLPLRLTLGPKTVARGAVELKRRGDAQATELPLDQLKSNLAQD